MTDEQIASARFRLLSAFQPCRLHIDPGLRPILGYMLLEPAWATNPVLDAIALPNGFIVTIQRDHMIPMAQGTTEALDRCLRSLCERAELDEEASEYLCSLPGVRRVSEGGGYQQ